MASKTLGQVLDDLSQTDSQHAAELYPPISEGDIHFDLSSDVSGRDEFVKYAGQNLKGGNVHHPPIPKTDAVPGHRTDAVPATKDGGTGNVYATTFAEAQIDPDNLPGTEELPSLLTDSLNFNTELRRGLFSKYKSPGDLSGPEMLRSDTGVTDASAMVQELLERVNKYTPGESSPFIRDAQKGEAGLGPKDNDGLYSLQVGPDAMGHFNKDAKTVSVRELRKAALETLFKTTGHPGDKALSAAEGVFGANNPFGAGTAALVMSPGGPQTGGAPFTGPNTIAQNNIRIRHTKSMKSFGADMQTGADDLIAVQSFEGSGAARGGDAKNSPTKNLPRNASTYGTMNNPSEPFGIMTPMGMFIAAIINLLIFAVLGLIISIILGLLVKIGNSAPKLPEEPWNLKRGDAVGNPGKDPIMASIAKLFGIPRMGGLKVMSSFMGLLLFFGINPTAKFGAALFDALINLLFAPGYYLLITKRALADFEQVSESMKAFGTTPFSINTIAALFGFMQAFFSSFTIQFFFLMSSLGTIYEQSKAPGAKAHLGEIVPLKDQPQNRRLAAENRNSMSRWHRGEDDVVGTHSLFTFNSALYTSPVNSIAGIAGSEGIGELPDYYNNIGVANEIIAGLYELNSASRMTPEEVDYIEDLIDAEYVPFSFHDVRTNEIISLPAFVSNIQDDFNTEYGTSHGFGRTDPVYSYAKTTRQIGLTFTLVAQNASDHEYMWFLINRLIAMCYPQRDGGLKRFMPDGKAFVQPFSQAVAASPMIRLRLGDTIASNASVRAMERIFGGKETLQAPPNLAPEDTKAYATAKSAQDAARDRVRGALVKSLNWSWENSIAKAGAQGFNTIEATIPPNVNDLGDQLTKHPIILAKGSLVAVQKTADPGAFPSLPPDPDNMDTVYFTTRYPLEVTVLNLVKAGVKANDSREAEQAGESGSPLPPILDLLGWCVKFDGITDERGAYALGGDTFLQYFRTLEKGTTFPPPFPPAEALIIVPRKTKVIWKLTNHLTVEAIDHFGAGTGGIKVTTNTKAKEAFAEATSGMEGFTEGRTIEEIGTFLSDANPLVKAFKSASGRGLAGFITQMSLQYSDKLWGTSFEAGATNRALRAPKAVDISIQFNPVHDYPLGLDEFGQMFAPSHPVGALAARNLNEYETAAEKLEKWKANAERKVTYLPPAED